MDSKEGVWKAIPVLFHTADQQNALGTVMRKENSSTSPQPETCHPANTHPEGRAAGCS